MFMLLHFRFVQCDMHHHHHIHCYHRQYWLTNTQADRVYKSRLSPSFPSCCSLFLHIAIHFLFENYNDWLGMFLCSFASFLKTTPTYLLEWSCVFPLVNWSSGIFFAAHLHSLEKAHDDDDIHRRDLLPKESGQQSKSRVIWYVEQQSWYKS